MIKIKINIKTIWMALRLAVNPCDKYPLTVGLLSFLTSRKTRLRMLLRIIFLSLFALVAMPSSAKTARAYFMTTSTSINESELHIINSSDTAQRFSGTLYERSGTRLGSANRTLHSGTIQASERLILTSPELETLFGVPPWSGPAMLEIEANSDFQVMIKLRSPSGFVSNSNCVTTDKVHNIEGFEQSDRTYVRFINIGTTTISTIRGTLYRSDGTRIGNSNQLILNSLSPKEQVFVNNNELSTIFGDDWIGAATLDVSGYDNLRLLNLNFVNGETFFNFSCIESTDTTDTAVAWSLPDLAGTWTGDASALSSISGPSCIYTTSVSGTMFSTGYFSGLARNQGTGASVSFSARTTSDAEFLVMGLAVGYNYGASFAGRFLDESTLRLYARDTDDCYSIFTMTKR